MIRRKKRIGILGGTFNPIHMGHLILAENAFWQFGLEKILIMPSNNPPHKSSASLILDEDRLAMVKLAIEDNQAFQLSMVEFEREGLTYTADTLTRLSVNYPEVEFYFIIGGDSLATIDKWKNPEVIFRLSHIIATTREDMDEVVLKKQIKQLKEKYNASIFQLKSPRIDISSQWIRECVKEKQSIRYVVPDKVAEYISKKQLYQTSK